MKRPPNILRKYQRESSSSSESESRGAARPSATGSAGSAAIGAELAAASPPIGADAVLAGSAGSAGSAVISADAVSAGSVGSAAIGAESARGKPGKLIDPSIAHQPILFGSGGDVQTVEEAYRYNLAAKLALKSWGRHDPLPVLFARLQQMQQRKFKRQPKTKARGQPLAPSRRVVVDEVMGMLIKHDGEFKLWQKEWAPHGPPSTFETCNVDEWVRTSVIGDPHPQLIRRPGHVFSSSAIGEGEGSDLANACSTVHAPGWSRRCLVISLAQLFLMKLHEFSADAIYSHWMEAETIIGPKPQRGRASK